jgi:signal transduction histidine kinase
MNLLFYQTRLRLASWYAGVMGCILGLCGLGVYQTVAHAYQETIDQGMESVANSLRGSIEPALQQPGQPQQLAQELSLELCQTQANCLTQLPAKHPSISSSISDPTPVNYYLRLIDLTNHPIALAGQPLDQLPIASGTTHWSTLTTTSGQKYRQISLPLHTQQNQPQERQPQESQLWGYLQVGRSLTDLDHHLIALRLTLLVGFPISLLFVGGSSWWLAGLAMQPIYRSYQQMRQFTADAAHELRTPLAAMQSTLDAALMHQQLTNSSPSSPPEDPLLMVLKRQNTRLSQLVKDLLLLARIDQQDLPKQRSRCSLNELIEDLIEELASLAIAAQVKLVAEIRAQAPISVSANADQLYRLMCNLMVNAIQATPTDGIVTVSLSRSESYAIIQVHDTGIGIAPTDQAHIFDRFYRIQSDRSRHTGGSGLGLSIANAIAQAHQGTIQVDSQVGKGSTFTVRLPID